MTLRHLEIFYAIMLCGSLTKAAQMLCISQPAASKALKHAEARLGFRLFERKQSKLIPTQEAHILFDQAQSIYGELNQLKELAHNLANHPQGRLSIGCIPSLGLSVVPRVTAQFAVNHPAIDIAIRTDHTETLIDRLMKCDIDFAITFHHVPTHNLTAIPLVKVPLVYLDAKPQNAPIHMADIEVERWIHPGTDSLAQLIARHRQFQNSHINVETYYMAAEFVKLGMGCTISDIFSAEQTLPIDMLYPINPAMHLDLCLLHRSNLALSSAARHYAQTLKEYLTAQIHTLNQKLYLKQ
ncbi:LysR family transcriptional regulator [Wohlfahrtiimonas chitiniclastica]|uniref:LysR family transcriptional regulator n=1 Tax=Wohlfahrtiimonas chitiniclastica TaxID=400946 RepID=UPI00215887C9|nr:LysR family transcriptional regulator [Wohlfahrtiimonas chitiniclastica]MDC7252893.1 LysR family transcriptional regulator [Wohlfahrtiimonas chitiniclastica]